jgi:REP element-mobilizing transposase RayT
MDQPPYEMDKSRREEVLEALIHRCNQSDWGLLAAHVRTNHVHVVVHAECSPEFVMTQLKSAISRRLNELGLDDKARKRWARHGSTRTLFDRRAIEEAICYVLERQGELMSIYQG